MAARQAYQMCQDILAQELNTTPGPDIEALSVQIDDRAGHRLPRTSAKSKQASFLQADLPLVGRVSEHTQLVTAYYTARRGQTQLVTLEGEAGIGKTRLASEFLGWAAAQGADVLRGRAFETGGRLPYQPLTEAIRPRLERETALDELLADVWVTELSRLLPELHHRYADLPPAPVRAEAEAQGRLFEAVGRLGETLARRKPLILFIDDLQWADVASRDILRYISRRWTDLASPILILLSLRSEALLTSPAFVDWLMGLRQDVPSTRLKLRRLTIDDTRQLVQRLAGATNRQVESFNRWLFAETRGQPFFMVETLKALLERNLLIPHLNEAGNRVIDFEAAALDDTSLNESLGIPPGVRDIIQIRLARCACFCSPGRRRSAWPSL